MNPGWLFRRLFVTILPRKMIIWVLSVWAFVFGVLAIRAHYKGPRLLVYLFRPITMAVIISLVLEAGSHAGPYYRYAIAAGLVISLAGDVFMMLRKKRFLEGLICFLVAQICYTFAFLSGIRLKFSSWPTLPLLIWTVLVVVILYPHLGKMRVPVIIYVLVIITMARAALERAIQLPGTAPLAAAAGGILFVISDSVVAFDRFVKPFRSAQAFILSAYFAAQWLIALSVCLR
jgi:uncharacterized membrane protein YhhN